MGIEYLKDAVFLKQLDNENLKTLYAKIIILDLNENPITEVSGRVTNQGSINLSGQSSLRRTANITFVAEEKNNDLQNVDSLLSINKKVQFFIGVENNINANYDDIIWFSQGIYVISQPNLSHSLSGVNISLSLKDKMCMLNGECGGTLPASITFHKYDQLQADGTTIEVPQLIYDIVQTLVCNYGGVPLNRIIINDLPKEIKQIVRYTGKNPLYYDTVSNRFTLNEQDVEGSSWKAFNFNEDVGYVYTDFTYPGELVSSIGDTVCSVLDKIISVLGNYEYFFDVNGNFIFQEIRNYLNSSYDAAEETFLKYRLGNKSSAETYNELNILDIKNYMVDYRSNTKSIYTFSEGSGLISSYSNSPSYSNIKNDFHIWGQNGDNQIIHYHLAIMEKPTVMNRYWVRFPKDADGNPTGEIKLATLEEYENVAGLDGEKWVVSTQTGAYVDQAKETMYYPKGTATVEKGVFYPNSIVDPIEEYIPNDWRTEMYLQGLRKLRIGQKPNIYEQELVDLFGSIYDFHKKRFKVDIVNNPNNLVYFFDALEPVDKIHNYSIDALYPRILTCQEEAVNKLYDKEIPNIILINTMEEPLRRMEILERCESEGQPFSNVNPSIFNMISIGTVGYAAHSKARELLYQHTNYSETITLQSIPIYYLDVNRRITVQDMASNIYGDYIINSISIPLTAGGTMSISATRAMERI